MRIVITGSEGLIGKQLSKHLSKNNKILKLDLKLGHDLANEEFVKDWFRKNKADSLVNCFALNDHIDNKRKKQTLFDISLESISDFLKINLNALITVCILYATANKKVYIVVYTVSLRVALVG